MVVFNCFHAVTQYINEMDICNHNLLLFVDIFISNIIWKSTTLFSPTVIATINLYTSSKINVFLVMNLSCVYNERTDICYYISKDYL